uniref:Uncharacterized protein n=1 Tax=Sphaerodactylus townsendi TaxID=933632 RepID=A0ACB8FZE2_9SAUR
MGPPLEKRRGDWQELEEEFQQLQETHKIYKQKLEELNSLQAACSSSIQKQKRGLQDFTKVPSYGVSVPLADERAAAAVDLKQPLSGLGLAAEKRLILR